MSETHEVEVLRERQLFVAFMKKRFARANEADCLLAWADAIGFVVPQIPAPWPPDVALDLIARTMKEAANRFISEHMQ